MKLKYLIYLLLFGIILFDSCRKSDDPTTEEIELPTYVYYNSCAYISGIRASDNSFYITSRCGEPTYSSAIIKISELGNAQFEIQIPVGAKGIYSKILQTKDGQIFIVSSQSSNGFTLSKINASGDTVWNKVYSQYKLGDSQAIGSMDGNLVICLTDFDVSKGEYSPVIMKLNPNGELIWSKQIEVQNSQSIFDLIQCSDGGYLLTGSSYFQPFSDGKNKVKLLHIKTDEDGNVMWINEQGIENSQYGLQTIELPSGDYFTIGIETSSNDKLITTRITNNGSQIWKKTFHDTLYFMKASGCLNEDGKISIVVNGTKDKKGLVWKSSLIEYDVEGRNLRTKTIQPEIDNLILSSIFTTSDGFIIFGSYQDKLASLRIDENWDYIK